MLFLPPYSSVLNPIEKVWNTMKYIWSKNVAKIRTDYNHSHFESDLNLILGQVRQKLSSKSLEASKDYYEMCLADKLV